MKIQLHTHKLHHWPKIHRISAKYITPLSQKRIKCTELHIHNSKRTTLSQPAAFLKAAPGRNINMPAIFQARTACVRSIKLTQNRKSKLQAEPSARAPRKFIIDAGSSPALDQLLPDVGPPLFMRRSCESLDPSAMGARLEREPRRELYRMARNFPIHNCKFSI